MRINVETCQNIESLRQEALRLQNIVENRSEKNESTNASSPTPEAKELLEEIEHLGRLVESGDNFRALDLLLDCKAFIKQSQQLQAELINERDAALGKYQLSIDPLRPKIEEWQACYAGLFRQITELKEFADKQRDELQAKIRCKDEALKPFAEFALSLKRWNNGKYSFLDQQEYPKHKPVITRTYPCDKENSYIRHLWVSDFMKAEKALAEQLIQNNYEN